MIKTGQADIQHVRCRECGHSCHCNWDHCDCGCDICDCGTTKAKEEIPKSFLKPTNL